MTPGVADLNGSVERLGEGQGVDVGAPGDGATGPIAAQHGDHAGARDARAHLELGGVRGARR